MVNTALGKGWEEIEHPCEVSASLVAQNVEESACNAGDLGSVPGSGHGTPLQYSCLENPMDRGAWRATVPGVTKSQTRLTTAVVY